MNPLWIMIQREFFARVVKRGYWLMTAFGLLIMVGLTFLPTVIRVIDSASRTSVVIADPKGMVAPQIAAAVNPHPDQYPLRIVWSKQNAASFTRDQMQRTFAAEHTHVIVAVRGGGPEDASFQLEQKGSIDANKIGLLESLLRQAVTNDRIQALNPADQGLLARPIPISVKQWQAGSKTESQLVQSTLLVYFMLILLFITTITYGAWVAQGVIEEKSNRIVEMLLIAVKPWQILFGKVLGIGLVGLVQYAIWTAAVGVSLMLQRTLSAVPVHSVPASTLAAFPLFFVVGYLTYATLFGIGGSLVHRPEEQQMAITPVTLVLVLMFYASMFVLYNPNSSFSAAVTFVPLAAPLAAFARLALSDAPVWQVLLSLCISALTLWFLIWVGAKTYWRFALRTTGKSGWRLLFRRTEVHDPPAADA